MKSWARLFRRSRLDRELDEEMRAHLALAVREKMERGESRTDAEASARREFGNQALTGEVTREMWGWAWLERLRQDVRYATRQLLRNPGFTAVAILSLALGIGANTAIFSIVNALLLRSLPVTAPGELFLLRQQSRATVPQRFSYPMFLRLRDAATGARGLAAMSRITRAQAAIGEASTAEIAPVQLVSGEFFSVLGISAVMGRTLEPGDNRILSGHPVAVISYGFWQRRLAGAADVVGRVIRLNGAQFTIVGVAPPDFHGVWIESLTDVWVPLMMQSDINYAQNYSSHDTADPERPWIPQDFLDWLDVIVRTGPAPGAVREALNVAFLRSMDTVTSGLGPNNRRYFLERSVALEPFARGVSNVRDGFSAPLFALMALVAMVLLIACANTANLLLARAEGRRREMAVRLSLGAGRRRVIQQLLTESLLLASAAAACGLLIARWAADFLVRMALGVTSGPTPLSADLDVRVLAFTGGVSLATALLFGLAPAFRASKTELADAMKTSSRGVTGGSPVSPAKFLVAAQVALSLVVISGAGLFARSLSNLANVQLGFDREHVLTVWINPRTAGFKGAQLPALYRDLVARVESVPGVRSAAISMCGLAVGCNSSSDGMRFPGYEAHPGENPSIQHSYVGPKYFSTVGARILSGREFDSRDRSNDPRVAVVNEALVRKYFAGRSPVGQQYGERMGKGELTTEIVGVVNDARVNRVRELAGPMAYYPLQGALVYAGSLEVRTAADPQAVGSAVRKAMAEVAPTLPIERIVALSQQVDRSLNQERMIATLTVVFGALALGLACFGLYGVVSYAVTRRTAEIGVRMALGAGGVDVLWTFLKGALGLILMGLAVGVPAVLMASRLVAPLLFEVKANDPVTLAAAALVLMLVAILAALLPSWRASRVNPVVALRHE